MTRLAECQILRSVAGGRGLALIPVPITDSQRDELCACDDIRYVLGAGQER